MSKYTSKSRLADTFLVPAITGATAAVATMAIAGDSRSVMNLFGMDLATPLAIGVTATGASLLGEVIGNWALPYIPGNYRSAQTEKLAIKPVATGAAHVGLMKFAAPEAAAQAGLTRAFGIGAGSEVVGRYGADFIRPMLTR